MTARQKEAIQEVRRLANLMLGMVGEAIAYSSNEELWDQLEDLLEVRKAIVRSINRTSEEVDPEAKPK